MNTWFTSDHHFGHTNIISYCDRPFANADQMNRELVQAWNDVVSPGDLVYYLGDFSLDANLVPRIVRQLNGVKILISGNHDKCWQKSDPANHWRLHYLDAGFESIEQTMHIKIAGESVLLSHLPYKNFDDPDQRYVEHRPLDDGGWLVHGHVHDRWRICDRQINVSVEMWDYRPASIGSIAEIIANGPQMELGAAYAGYQG